jgi:hypothetical protein
MMDAMENQPLAILVGHATFHWPGDGGWLVADAYLVTHANLIYLKGKRRGPRVIK